MSELDTLLASLEALEKAATPGPWEDCGDELGACATDKHQCGSYVADCEVGTWDEPEQKANAALIVAARNALPSLLALARAAIALRGHLGRVADEENGVDYNAALEEFDLAAKRAGGNP